VTDRDVAGVTLRLAAGARVSGRVEFEDGAPSSSDLLRFGFTLSAADDRFVPVPPPVPVDQARQFRTGQYPPGRYLIAPVAAPPGWTVKSAMAGTVNIYEQPLTVSDRDVEDVVVTMTRQRTTLAGRVIRPGGTGDPHAQVAVFPADHEAWIAEGMSSRRFRSAAAQPDGSFDITGLTAGEYIAAAVGAAHPLDGRDPAVVAALARIGTRVSIRNGSNHVAALTVTELR
jgi:hypothetical protein